MPSGTPSRSRTRLMVGICLLGILLASVLGATPTAGQGVSTATVERAARARASYGLPASPSRVRELLIASDEAATAQYGFPLTRAEHAELMARNAYARAFEARTLPVAERLPGFGGAWLDQRDGGTMVVGLKQVRKSAKQQVRARLPRENRGVRFVKVDDSAAELDRALARADRDWAALSSIRPQAFGVSYRQNRLLVKVLPGQLAKARRLTARMARRAGVDVAVKPTARVADSACPTRNKCWKPLRLGTRINHGAVYRARAPRTQWSCAVGFMLTDGSILTAGHCLHRHAGPWHGHKAYRSRFGRIGYRVASRYTSNHRDVGRIRLEDWKKNRSARIFGDAWPTVLTQPGTVIDNMDVCVSLARQDRFWCGRVTEPTARWRSSTAGIWVWGAGMRFHVRGRTSLPGDSGSPVVAKSQDCPTCAPRRTPIGIVNAGREVGRARDTEGAAVNADLYFAKLSWALGEPKGWPWLKVYTGRRPDPTPEPTPDLTPEPTARPPD